MQTDTSIDYAATLNVLTDIVAQARARLLAIPRDDIQAEKKADNSFVTRADRETEIFLRTHLQELFPGHSILGEEFPSVEKDSPFLWVIDPIDGTHSFKHNIPLYGIMVCLVEHGKPVVSVVDLPAIDRCYAAAKGKGTTCNGIPVHLQDLSPEDLITDEVIATCQRTPFVRCDRTEVFDSLVVAHKDVRIYPDCFGHMLAAEGAVGAMVDFNIRVWDCLPSVLIVEEAGGKAICVGKRSTENTLYRYDWVIGKPSIVDWLCEQHGLQEIDY